MRVHRDLELVAWGSILCALAALLSPWEAVSVVFALPLAMFSPGYAIATAAFARRKLLWAHLLLLSIALSLCVLALGALLLDYVPGGIREITWGLLLLLVVVNGCRTAALRRPPAPEGTPEWPHLQLGKAQAGLLGGGALAAVAALALAMTPLPADDALGYTELWISASNKPSGAVAQVGVRSQEKREVDYFVRVRFGKTKHDVRLLGLQPDQERIIKVRGPALSSGRPTQVTASLFRQEQPEKIYRRVLTWIPPTQEQR
jgi:uncharacterized membrane protein